MKWILFLVFVTSCTQVTSLNMKKHEFGILPLKVIWFQIAGLDEEQVAMLRFNQPEERRTAFEESICIGKAWNYNLYKLRPSAEESFMAQMTGKKNIKNNCEDTKIRPIWGYLNESGYQTGILENGVNDTQSMAKFNKCDEQGLIFMSSLYFWLSKAPVPGAVTFHYREPIPVIPNKITYDRSCGEKSCSSSVSDNLPAIYTEFNRISNKNLMIVRDFSYLEALNKKDFVGARTILYDLEKSYSWALELAKDSSEILVLLTTGDSRFVDMPDQGKSWYDFEKSGANVNLKRTQLTNLVLASGVRAENFCGIYEDSNVFERILSGPKQQGLELKLINPFK